MVDRDDTYTKALVSDMQSRNTNVVQRRYFKQRPRPSTLRDMRHNDGARYNSPRRKCKEIYFEKKRPKKLTTDARLGNKDTQIRQAETIQATGGLF